MTFSRTALSVLAATMILSGTGCFMPPFSTSRDEEDSQANVDDVILLDRYVAPRIMPDRIAIQRTDFLKDDNGYPVMSVEMRSLRTGYELKFDIRSSFKDAEGRTVDTTAWSPKILAPGETFTYRGIGTQTNAIDGQIQIRKMR